MRDILLHIGPLKIYSYGLFVFLGVLISYFVFRALLGGKGLKVKTIENIFLSSLLGGFIFSRILYISINFKDFLEDPWVFVFSRSGFVFYGGLIGGILGMFLYCRMRGLDSLEVLDTGAVGLSIGHSLGRIGCFLHGCCFGRPTQGWWGVEFPLNSPAGFYFPHQKIIPTQIISSLFLFLLFLFLLSFYKRRRFKGQVFSYYLILYPGFRFFIEFLRADPRPFIGPFSIFQLVSLPFIFVGIFFYLRLKFST